MAVIAVGRSSLLQYCDIHSHGAWEIILNQSGSGTMIVGDQEIPFVPGTIVCIPPELPHNKTSPGMFQDIYIRITGFDLQTQAAGTGALWFRDDEDGSLDKLMMMAHHIFHKQEPNSRSIVEALVEVINQLLIGWWDRPPVQENPQVEQLKNRLIDSFTDPEFSVSQLLAQSAYCPDHLRRLFKKSTGMTPGAYLTDLRIRYAQKLMQENAHLHNTIGEISVLAGFYDRLYFSQVFKKKTGLTPSAYLASCHPDTSDL